MSGRHSMRGLFFVIACGSSPPPAAPLANTAPTGAEPAPAASGPFRIMRTPAAAGEASIIGTIRDARTREPLAGVTLVLNAPTLIGERVFLSDEQGRFTTMEFPAGTYTLTAFYSDATIEGRIDVEAGTRAELELLWDLTAQTPEAGTDSRRGGS